MARQRCAACPASTIRSALATATAAASSGGRFPGAADSAAARSRMPIPSAPIAPNPAIAAASGARREL
ncbi:MAG TPA: hypothetical protein VGG75_36110 [Trebonia sp.]|jgi:hypothetical protein